MKNSLIIWVLLSLAFFSAETNAEDKWIQYNGHNISFEYPSSWGIVESSTGVLLGQYGIFSFSIVMHKEGCYPLAQHPYLMDWLLKAWGSKMFGVADGKPITQFFETEIGPYSDGTQLYKNPNEYLICEIQGYSAKNATVTFVLSTWNPTDPKWSDRSLEFAKLRKSLKVTLPDVNSSSQNLTNPILFEGGQG